MTSRALDPMAALESGPGRFSDRPGPARQWVCSKLDVQDQLPLLILRKAECFRVGNEVRVYV